MIKKFTILACVLLTVVTTQAQTINPDDAVLALKDLKQLQNELSHEAPAKGPAQVAQIERMLKLGVWDKAWQLINAAPATADLPRHRLHPAPLPQPPHPGHRVLPDRRVHERRRGGLLRPRGGQG